MVIVWLLYALKKYGLMYALYEWFIWVNYLIKVININVPLFMSVGYG